MLEEIKKELTKLRQVLGKVAYYSRGTYDSSFLYKKHDVVTYEGSSYVALKETKGNLPTNEEFFMLLAKKGDQGIQGVQGEVGPMGPQGPKGNKGDKGDTYEVTEADLQSIATQITENANSEFNQHIESKTNEFDTHVNTKTTEYNTNADNKVNEFNNSVDSIKKDINDNTSRSKRIEKVLYDSGEAEGTFINVKDSTLAEMQEVRIKNIEKQEVTEKNKNYFTGRDLVSSTMRGVTFNFDNSIIKLDGTSESAGVVYNTSSTKIKLSAGTWTLSFKVKSGTFTLSQNDLAIYIKNENNDNIVYFSLRDLEANVNSKQFTLEEETTILFYAYTNNSNVVLDNLEIVMQIEPGEIATEFEQFVPLAPAPDEIREIKAIDKNFNLISCNKNLFDKSTISFYANNSSSFENKTNNSNIRMRTSSFSLKKSGINYNEFYTLSGIPENWSIARIRAYDSEKSILSDTGNDDEYVSITKNKFKIKNSKVKYIHFLFKNDNSSSLALDEFNNANFQLENRNEKTDFIEHQKTVLPILVPEGQFVADLDEYIIRYNEEDKKAHLHLKKNVDRLILDGTEDWQGTFDNFNIFLNCKDGEARCTHLIKDSSAARDNSFYFENGKLILHNVYVNNILISTIEELKNYLVEEYTKDTPVTIYYELAEPYILDLGVVDMPLTFLNETNVCADCDLDTEIKINYYRNPKLTIKELQKNLSLADSKILTLESDINTLKEQVSQLMTSQVNNTIENTEESELIDNDISSE